MKRILVAVDGNEEMSKLVIAQAVELARSLGGRLRLVQAVPIQPFPSPVMLLPLPPEQAESPAVIAREALRCLASEIPDALRDGIVVEHGSPADVVCAAARTYDADVVVIGAHEYGLIARVLGTTAASIVDRIDRPLFVVRPLTRGVAPSEFLHREHARLERIYAELLSAYKSGDWAEVRARWDAFEPALRAHMEKEEKLVFPAFRASDPSESAALLAEHDELRRLLGTLGVGVDLHVVSVSMAAELVGRLRAHGAREELLLYPWLDRSSPEAAQRGNGGRAPQPEGLQTGSTSL